MLVVVVVVDDVPRNTFQIQAGYLFHLSFLTWATVSIQLFYNSYWHTATRKHKKHSSKRPASSLTSIQWKMYLLLMAPSAMLSIRSRVMSHRWTWKGEGGKVIAWRVMENVDMDNTYIDKKTLKMLTATTIRHLLNNMGPSMRRMF